MNHLLLIDQERNGRNSNNIDIVELPEELKQDGVKNKLSNSFFFFESKVGQGNILDFIRSGRAPFYKDKQAGREMLQFKEVRTHILDRLKLFLMDDKILFIPKSEQQIETEIQRLNGTSQRYHTQEVGIYHKIIEQLKFSSAQDEERYLSVYDFILQNSKEIQPISTNNSSCLTSKNPINFYLRDDNGALEHLGVHRDTTVEDKQQPYSKTQLFFRSTNSTMKQPNFDKRAD